MDKTQTNQPNQYEHASLGTPDWKQIALRVHDLLGMCFQNGASGPVVSGLVQAHQGLVEMVGGGNG